MCKATTHGSRHAYRSGCRCPSSMEAVAAYYRRRNPKGQLLRSPRDRSPHVDEIAVARACHGEPVELTVAERGEAIRRLSRQGLPAREIALRLRMNPRTVQRHRTGQVAHGRREGAA